MDTQAAARPAFSICVFCASRPGTRPEFSALAAQVGRWIGERGGQMVFGGGRAGLMGVAANAALEAGARVVGVIPEALVELEHAHNGCTELLVVDTMHERKQLMADHADAFLVLPGGIGTFEEFFEVWSWRQLGYHDKPVGLLNAGGYYAGLLTFLEHCVAQGLMSRAQMDLMRVGSSVDSLLPELAGSSRRVGVRT